MRTSRPLRRALATLALTLVAAPVVAIVASSQGTAEDTGAFRVLGSLPDVVNAPPKRTGFSQTVVAIDAPSRRLFLLHPGADDVQYIVTYSLKTRIPKQIGVGKAGVLGDFPIADNYTATFDSKRGNVALISSSVQMNGPHTTDTGNVTIYSDVQHKVVDHWNFHDRVPGFYPMGITYSAKDDRYYAIGEFSSQRFVADGTPVFGSKAVGPVSAVVSFEAGTGKVQFVKPIAECQQVLYSKGIGALIARGTAHDAVYFPCVSGGTAAGQTYPGQAGLVRATVSSQGDSVAAAQWPVEFFPISGNYFAGGSGSGVAAFDRMTDRFYFQSISFKTPGAWVFDGRLTAWVGFVASPVPQNFFAGVNECMGHYYMGVTSSAVSAIIVANVRQTPVPAGEQVPVSTSGLIVADCQTRRLFLRPPLATDRYLVVEDLTEVTNGDDVIDWDADTSNTPDTPAASVFYGLGATGYGAQAVQVGGASSPVTAIGGASQGLPRVAANTRALMTSRVGAIDLRSGGAAASAQAALPDYNTITEYEGETAEACDGTSDPAKCKEETRWPYPVNSCLDAGGDPTIAKTVRDDGHTGPANGGVVTITCDLGKNIVTASTRMGATASGAMHLGKTSYYAEARRTMTDGGIVETKATASGISFEIAGGYDLRIGSVIATTKSVAHGRPGTTKSLWTRNVDGIRVTDPTGKNVLTAPGCDSMMETTPSGTKQSDSCRSLASTLSRLLQTRLRIDFPMPLMSATPKGAFAGVEQTATEYFNQNVINDQGVIYRGDSIGLRPTPAIVAEVYNDTTERSRTVAVLAATQGYAIFTVQPPYADGWTPDITTPDNSGSGVVAPGITPVDNSAGGDTGPAVPQPQSPNTPSGTTAIPVADVTGWLFMRRSLKDIVLLLLLSGLVLGGAGTAWRRRRLVDVLTTVPGKEAAL